jgi:hypothetical protein
MTTAQAINRNSAVYHPRVPTASPLYKLLFDHFTGFVASYDTKFSRSHGFFRPVIEDVVHAYLKCGDLKQGFARVRCPDCHHEYLLAFSCRGRWFRSLVHRLPVQVVMPKRSSSSVKCFGKTSYTRFPIDSMLSAFR